MSLPIVPEINPLYPRYSIAYSFFGMSHSTVEVPRKDLESIAPPERGWGKVRIDSRPGAVVMVVEEGKVQDWHFGRHLGGIGDIGRKGGKGGRGESFVEVLG